METIERPVEGIKDDKEDKGVLVQQEYRVPPFPIARMTLSINLAILVRQREAQRLRRSAYPPVVRPLLPSIADTGRRYSLAHRAQCLTLLTLGISGQ